MVSQAFLRGRRRSRGGSGGRVTFEDIKARSVNSDLTAGIARIAAARRKAGYEAQAADLRAQLETSDVVLPTVVGEAFAAAKAPIADLASLRNFGTTPTRSFDAPAPSAERRGFLDTLGKGFGALGSGLGAAAGAVGGALSTGPISERLGGDQPFGVPVGPAVRRGAGVAGNVFDKLITTGAAGLMDVPRSIAQTGTLVDPTFSEPFSAKVERLEQASPFIREPLKFLTAAALTPGIGQTQKALRAGANAVAVRIPTAGKSAPLLQGLAKSMGNSAAQLDTAVRAEALAGEALILPFRGIRKVATRFRPPVVAPAEEAATTFRVASDVPAVQGTMPGFSNGSLDALAALDRAAADVLGSPSGKIFRRVIKTKEELIADNGGLAPLRQGVLLVRNTEEEAIAGFGGIRKLAKGEVAVPKTRAEIIKTGGGVKKDPTKGQAQLEQEAYSRGLVEGGKYKTVMRKIEAFPGDPLDPNKALVTPEDLRNEAIEGGYAKIGLTRETKGPIEAMPGDPLDPRKALINQEQRELDAMEGGARAKGLYKTVEEDVPFAGGFQMELTGARTAEQDLIEAYIQRGVEDGSITDYHHGLRDAIEAQARQLGYSGGSGQGPPRLPPALSAHFGGLDADGALDQFLWDVPGIKPQDHILAKAVGMANMQGLESRLAWRNGQQLLREHNMGVSRGLGERQKQYFFEGETDDILAALHGEGEIPTGWDLIYKDLRARVMAEEQRMLASDPNFARAMMDHPQYFPRLWAWKGKDGKLIPVHRNVGPLGKAPGFKMPRVGASFKELRAEGFVPISSNPYDIMLLRETSGVAYRQQSRILKRLEQYKLAKPLHEVTPEEAAAGWKVPEGVGPAFNGRPYPKSDGGIGYTPAIAVPKIVANNLVKIYGPGVTGPLQWAEHIGQNIKRVKLFGALFQDFDFALRAAGASFTPTGIKAGAPFKYPSLLARLFKARLLPGQRKKITEKLLSDTPIVTWVDAEGVAQSVSYKMVGQEGGMFGIDTTLLRREVVDGIGGALREGGELPQVKILRYMKQLNKFMEDGLFDGIYPEAQMFGLDNFIVPSIRRANPTLNGRQVAALAADQMNIKYSTLGEWQTVINDPNMRALTRALAFSANESEAWIRMATRAMRGAQKRLWGEYGLGLLTFMALFSNFVNLTSTGKPMPLKSYLPITTGNPGALIPGGIDYNTRFMSPELPFKGRGGATLYLDVLGQADTFMRWILNPPAAIGARANVMPRAFLNQAQGKDFYGNQLDSLKQRARQAMEDILMPIGAGNITQIVRQVMPSSRDFLVPAEDRLGTAGSSLQSTGINIRTETSNELLDRYTRNANIRDTISGKVIKRYRDASPSQRQQIQEDNPQLVEELEERRDTSALRGITSAKARKELDKTEQTKLDREDAAFLDWKAGNTTGIEFRQDVDSILSDTAVAKSKTNEIYERFKEDRKLPDHPGKAAIVQYYDQVENATRESGRFEFDEFLEMLDELESGWTKEQKKYVQDNIHLAEHHPAVQQFLEQRRKFSYFFNVDRLILVDENRVTARRNYAKLSANPGARERLEQQYPDMKLWQQNISGIRTAMRNQDDELAIFMHTYYGYNLPEHLASLADSLSPFAQRVAPVR